MIRLKSNLKINILGDKTFEVLMPVKKGLELFLRDHKFSRVAQRTRFRSSIFRVKEKNLEDLDKNQRNKENLNASDLPSKWCKFSDSFCHILLPSITAKDVSPSA